MTDREFQQALLSGSFLTPVGLDLGQGKRDVNLLQQVLKTAPLVEQPKVQPPVISEKPKEEKPGEYTPPPEYKGDTRTPADLINDLVRAQILYETEMDPIRRRREEEASQRSIEQAEETTRRLFPYLRAAGIDAQERALSASQRFKAFKEMLPSNVQAIMESKQRQQQLASDAFAREAQAIATQQSAATGFGTQGIGRYSGRRIA